MLTNNSSFWATAVITLARKAAQETGNFLNMVFAVMQISTQINVHSGGITTDGNANAYEYFIQIWRKVHKLCTFPNKSD